ncbi:MAG TPA: hypothetical protein PK360_17705, partial [bacterium]|nr:hypothetical protein [bacterium]
MEDPLIRVLGIHLFETISLPFSTLEREQKVLFIPPTGSYEILFPFSLRRPARRAGFSAGLPPERSISTLRTTRL